MIIMKKIILAVLFGAFSVSGMAALQLPLFTKVIRKMVIIKLL